MAGVMTRGVRRATRVHTTRLTGLTAVRPAAEPAIAALTHWAGAGGDPPFPADRARHPHGEQRAFAQRDADPDGEIPRPVRAAASLTSGQGESCGEAASW